jgi:hypothetical protein
MFRQRAGTIGTINAEGASDPARAGFGKYFAATRDETAANSEILRAFDTHAHLSYGVR